MTRTRNSYVDIKGEFFESVELVKKRTESQGGDKVVEQITRKTYKAFSLSCGHSQYATDSNLRNKAGKVACHECTYKKWSNPILDQKQQTKELSNETN